MRWSAQVSEAGSAVALASAVWVQEAAWVFLTRSL
jgi:hypothetical protein